MPFNETSKPLRGAKNPTVESEKSEAPQKKKPSPAPETPNPSSFREEDWSDVAANSDDHLLNCLSLLSRMFGRPMSSVAFRAGLPLVNNRLTPELFVRAAARAGLSGRIMKKKLSSISKLTLPCVLLLTGNKACLFVGVSDDGEEAEVIFPEAGMSTTKIPLKDLGILYTGLSIFARPLYRYDDRSASVELEKPRSWFWGTLSKFWPLYSQVAIAAIVVNIFAVASPLFTMNVYDRVVPNQATDTLWVLAMGVFLIFGFDFLLRMLRGYFVDVAGQNADVILGSRLFEQVIGLKLASRPASSGSFASQLREFESLREFFSSATLVALVDLPFVLLFLTIIWAIGGPVAYVPTAIIPIILIGSYFAQLPLNGWVRRTFREGAQKHALLIEAINGIETIKTFNAESRMQKNWEIFVSQAAGSNRSVRFISLFASTFSVFWINLSTVLVIVVGVYQVGEGNLTMGGLIACSILSSRTLAPLAQVVALLVRLNQSKTALQVLDKVINMPVERPIGKPFLHRPRLKGHVRFNNISFSYPGEEIKVLENFSLEIKAGERVGIIGRIGSGKSTLEKLLLGLYEPDEGEVLVDETDTRQIDPADLRQNIGYVPQEIYHFYGNIRENILLGNEDVDDASFMRAASLSGVLDFIRRHPKGFDVSVGEGGNALSGGQRQAIAIARAILKDPPIYLLDEPTAMMDQGSEARLVARLKDVFVGKTIILVTHRNSLLSLVDRLIVIDGGKVVADGPQEQVLKALNNTQIRGGS
ncbi:MAG: type I secretion system permease/ATPase [bacterium]|nr:type I secretion system permease/ATPase [bacterium]